MKQHLFRRLAVLMVMAILLGQVGGASRPLTAAANSGGTAVGASSGEFKYILINKESKEIFDIKPNARHIADATSKAKSALGIRDPNAPLPDKFIVLPAPEKRGNIIERPATIKAEEVNIGDDGTITATFKGNGYQEKFTWAKGDAGQFQRAEEYKYPTFQIFIDAGPRSGGSSPSTVGLAGSSTPIKSDLLNKNNDRFSSDTPVSNAIIYALGINPEALTDEMIPKIIGAVRSAKKSEDGKFVVINDQLYDLSGERASKPLAVPSTLDPKIIEKIETSGDLKLIKIKDSEKGQVEGASYLSPKDNKFLALDKSPLYTERKIDLPKENSITVRDYTEKGKNSKIRFSGGREIEIPKEYVENILAKVKGGFNFESSTSDMVTFKSVKDGKTESFSLYIIGSETTGRKIGDTDTVTTQTIKGINTKTTESVIGDFRQKEIKEGDTVKSVSYTTSLGKTINVNKDAWDTIKGDNVQNTLDFIRIAEKLGIQEIAPQHLKKDADAGSTATGPRIVKAEGNLYGVEGNSLVMSIQRNAEGVTTTQFTNTNFKDNNPTFQDGSQATEFKNGKLAVDTIYSKDVGTGAIKGIKANYDEKTMTLTSGSLTDNKFTADESTATIIVHLSEKIRLPGEDLNILPSAYEVTVGDNPYLWKPSSGPLGLIAGGFYDINTGKPLTEDQLKEIPKELLAAIENKIDVKSKAEGRPTESQSSSQAFFSAFKSAVNDYSGLAGYSSLFFTDQQLFEWRNAVDKAFATLYLGTEYWSSEMCSVYVDGEQQ
ncbi:MAG: hypothetical protein HY518_05860, partial [Candidatus Aenigmarchaeota archaeon]|nr:hypothetical protein [Candidatus Aenigmarchaeota archaeon]